MSRSTTFVFLHCLVTAVFLSGCSGLRSGGLKSTHRLGVLRGRSHPGSQHFSAKVVLLSKGRKAEDAGNLEKARSIYEQLQNKFPNSPMPYNRLGIVADQQQRHEQAQRHFTKALRRSPQNAEILNNLGYCFFLQGKLDKAESALLKATRLDPREPRYQNNLGMVQGHLERDEEALEAFRRAGSEAGAQYNLAFVLAARNEFEEAKGCFRLALASDPSHKAARQALKAFEEAEQTTESRDVSDPSGEKVRWVRYVEDNDSTDSASAPFKDEPILGGTKSLSPNRMAGARARQLHSKTRRDIQSRIRRSATASLSDIPMGKDE